MSILKRYNEHSRHFYMVTPPPSPPPSPETKWEWVCDHKFSTFKQRKTDLKKPNNKQLKYFPVNVSLEQVLHKRLELSYVCLIFINTFNRMTCD